MDDKVRAYIDAIAPDTRPVFDRIHRLVVDMYPDSGVKLSYQMPTFTVGQRRLFVGAWKHGLSFYGWDAGRDAGFLDRHPELKISKGTIQLRPDQASQISDDELRALIRVALDK
jgi:uncharacterized protein YdhG (YjbR/CyaY superfamily)